MAECAIDFVPPFTDPEFARQAGLKSAQRKAEREQELANLRSLVASTKLVLPDPAANLPAFVQQEVKDQLELSEEQIIRTRARLNSDDCADKERAALLRELRGLMEHRLRLRGIGEPARMKPVQESSQRIKAAVVVPLDCGQEHTTGSVPAQPAEHSIPQSAQETKAQ